MKRVILFIRQTVRNTTICKDRKDREEIK